MSNVREMTVGDVVALVTSARKVIAHFTGDDTGQTMPTPPRVHDCLLKYDTGEPGGTAKAKGLVDMLSEDLTDLKVAVARFEMAPAGVGRASAGKK